MHNMQINYNVSSKQSIIRISLVRMYRIDRTRLVCAYPAVSALQFQAGVVQSVSDQKGLGEGNIWTLVALGEVVGGRRSDTMLGVLVIHQHVVLGALVTAVSIRYTIFYLLVLWNMEHKQGIVFIKIFLLEFFL